MVMKKILMLFVVALLLASCNKSTEDNLQYMPFQEEEDGSWGMISPKGEVLFSNEFKEQPTVVMNDRFFAKNGNGKWELYSAGEKPRQVGKAEYEEAGAFIEDVAPVVVKGQKIQFIDKDGNVKFTLENINGKPVEECTNFKDGVAIIKVGDYYGCINTSGKIIVQPEYVSIYASNDGMMVAVHKKYAGEDTKKSKITVLSNSGKVISEISMKKFERIGEYYQDGAQAVGVNDNEGNTICGLIDVKGEYIVKPTSKIKSISQILHKKFVFYDGENYGLMDFNGDIVIRAKYKELYLLRTDGLLYAKDNGKDGFKLINDKDEDLSKDEYKSVLDFYGDCSFVQDNSDDWILINEKGEDQKIKTDIRSISDSYYGDNTFTSQYFDIDAFVNSLNLKPDGFMGANLSQAPEQAIKTMDMTIYGHLDESQDAYGNRNTKELYREFDINNVPVVMRVSYGDLMVDATEEANGDYNYFYLTTIKPQEVKMEIMKCQPLEGKMDELTAAILKKVKRFGSVTSENKLGAIVKVGQHSYYVANLGEDVVISCYDDSSIYYDINTPQYSREIIPSADSTTTVEESDDYGELGSPPADDL